MRGMADCSVHAIVTDPPYGLGFMGKGWDALPPGREWAEECLRVLKPGGHLLAFGGTRTYHRLACAIEDAGFEIRDCLVWLYGSGFPKSHNLKGEHEGWGTALKPAHEPVVVARKPLVGTVARNVLEFGTGAVNVDGCRVGTGEDKTDGGCAGTSALHDGGITSRAGVDKTVGRWPANVVLDEQAAALLDEQTGELTSGRLEPHHRRNVDRMGTNSYGHDPGRESASAGRAFGGDKGGASRFFYVAKASSRERNAGLERFEARAINITEGHGRGPVNTSKKSDGGVRENRPRQNTHPTVKPIALMRWLVRLVTPPGGVVLDPFAGSGTTGCACALEGFEFVGVEREPEYVDLANARIAWWASQRDDQEVLF